MSSRGRAAQLGSSSFRKSYACSSRALLLGAGWSTAEVKTRTGPDAPALALLDRRHSPSFHKVSKSELKGSPTTQDHLALRCPKQIDRARVIARVLSWLIVRLFSVSLPL